MSSVLLKFAVSVLLCHSAVAQTIKCITVGDGCDDGNAHEAALKSAAAKFQANKLYGNSNSRIVFSSALGSDGSLAQISYACTDGSIPPTVLGSSLQSYVGSILECTNRCGSVSHPQNAKCGLGVLIANDASTTPCFSKALNVAPASFDPVENPSVGDWRSRGCFVDLTNNERALKGGDVSATDMTVSKCLTRAAGYKYAGLEGSTECYFGNEISSSATTAPAGDCNVPCGGLITEACGAARRIRIYQNEAYSDPITTTTITTITSSTPTPTIVPSVDSFGSPVCYTEDKNSRVLVNGSKSDNSATGITVEKCVDLAESWRYGGVTAGGDCFWGDALMHSQKATQDDCLADPCAGDETEACGSSKHILVYEDEDFTVPTRLEAAGIVDDYIKLLAELQSAIREWDSLIQQYFDGGGTDGPLNKRDLLSLIPMIRTARLAILARRAVWKLYVRTMRLTGRRGRRYSRLSEAESIRLDDLGSQVSTSLSRIESVGSGTLSEARTISKEAVLTIGGLGGVIATGLFKSALELLNRLRSGGDKPPPEDPDNPGIPSLPTWPPGETPPMPTCDRDGCDGDGQCDSTSSILRRMRMLSKRTYPIESPDDIDDEINTGWVTNVADFTDQNTFANLGLTPSRWWRMIKRLVWDDGSHHGYEAPGQPRFAHPSSRFVDFAQNPEGTVITGAGPVYGCTCLVVVTDQGAYTAHFWEGFFGPDHAASFQQNVIDFLTNGDFRNGQSYEGLVHHLTTFMFRRILYVGIMTPELTEWNEQAQRFVGFDYPRLRYRDDIARLRNEVARLLGVTVETVETMIYRHDSEIFRLNENRDDWITERGIRMDNEPFRGYLTIQRRATDQGPDMLPAVRVLMENTLVFQKEWDPSKPPTAKL